MNNRWGHGSFRSRPQRGGAPSLENDVKDIVDKLREEDFTGIVGALATKKLGGGVESKTAVYKIFNTVSKIIDDLRKSQSIGNLKKLKTGTAKIVATLEYVSKRRNDYATRLIASVAKQYLLEGEPSMERLENFKLFLEIVVAYAG